MSIFKIGMKVVCVTPHSQWQIFDDAPRKDKIYTIIGIIQSCCTLDLVLREVDNKTKCYECNVQTFGYNSINFKPLVSNHIAIDNKDLIKEIVEEQIDSV